MSVVNKYENSKVYKIWSPSRPELVYYGSTVNDLAKRLYHHKDKYKRYKEGKYYRASSFNIFDQCSDYRIELVESFACNNRNELTAREGYYIRTNECVNKYVAGRTQKEWYHDHKEQIKQYYQDNRDKIKEHYEANKEQAKQYYQANKERLQAKQKQYYALKKK